MLTIIFFPYLCSVEHVITIKSLSELESAARDFLSQVGDHRLLAFEAPMGAGKTTFIAALCRVLGVDADAVSSPTFALVNEYRARGGEPVYHFDFYRIEHPSEALDIGFYEYVDSGCLCLMEWPGNIAALLPEETLIVRISVSPDGVRTLSWAD
ncbi:MAG: tRNA (adenosine(37)-N6)-threonylcarbamoyltransferase complex ATPase subunit type 1 TsaE [Bacteroidales bacterium]|nr:tRNA (adenosine(37)-N6)-threonylcarbamoyltransferase complex ATPase subunit type 1 TsaE [Bacteroidales bacterium]